MSNAFYDDWEDLLSHKSHAEGDCIIWDAGCHSTGYPMVRWDGQMVMVKRKMMEDKLNIKLVRSQRIRHVGCDNIKCINPDHYALYEYGEEEWNCYKLEYEERLRQEVEDLYTAWVHPLNGTKYGAIPHIKKNQERLMSSGTIRRILKQRNIFPEHMK